MSTKKKPTKKPVVINYKGRTRKVTQQVAEMLATDTGGHPSERYKTANPEHHKVGGLETIDILQAKLSPEELRGYLKGNVIKYLFRAKSKGQEADYIKANWYANMLAGIDPR